VSVNQPPFVIVIEAASRRIARIVHGRRNFRRVLRQGLKNENTVGGAQRLHRNGGEKLLRSDQFLVYKCPEYFLTGRHFDPTLPAIRAPGRADRNGRP
jgi:hypothetical protein